MQTFSVTVRVELGEKNAFFIRYNLDTSGLNETI